MVSVPDWLHDVLHEYSTDRLHILFDGFKVNHMADGIISLWMLGADEKRIRKYAEINKQGLEPAIQLDELTTKLEERELKDLLGARKRYLHLVQHYLLVSRALGGDLDRLINKEYPKLAAGLGSAALHGPIHVGYGYSVKNERIVCEGLALLHFTYTAHVVSNIDKVVKQLGRGDNDILTALEEIRNDGSHLEFSRDGVLKSSDVKFSSKFSRRFHTPLIGRGDRYAELVSSIKLPEWFNNDGDIIEQVPRLCQWMTDCSTLVYAMTEPKNNFFILHAVTGAWGLSQILPILQSGNDVLQSVVYFLSAVVAVYISQDCPPLLQQHLDLDAESLTWEVVKERAMEKQNNEHIYKLVQVVWERAQENKQDIYMAKVYLKAANFVLDYPYSRA